MKKLLINKTVVFTGFRDAALRKAVEEQGGRVTSAVSGKTDVLVVSGSKGVNSAKLAGARALGVSVTTREDFEKSLVSKKTPTPSKKGETCYINIDNGDSVFRTCMNSRRFWVTSFREGNVVVPPTAYSRFFVGRSPENKMTKFTKGFGPEFDGNSMLFELPSAANNTKRKYVFVGADVRSFFAAVPIKSFLSPLDNSGVPNPYAVDRNGAVYFFGHDSVTVMPRPSKEIALDVANQEDLFGYYYELCNNNKMRRTGKSCCEKRSVVMVKRR